MMTPKHCYDITLLLGRENTTYPGDQPYVRSEVSFLPQFPIAKESSLALSAHSGTHLDAPAHIFVEGRNLDDYPPEAFILPATVVEIADLECVQLAEIAHLQGLAGEAVLFKTENSRSGLVCSGELSKQFVYLHPEAAQWLAAQGVALVGLDYLSVDSIPSPGFPAHLAILGAEALVLENINLRDVPPGRYTLLALPLRMACCEGSPVRAVLMAE